MLVKKMSRVTARAAALAIAALLCSRVHAEPPQLPAKAIGEDTFMVVHVDASKVDPDSIDKTLAAVLGPNAAMAQQGMADFRTKYKEIADMGAQAVTITASGPVGGDKEPAGVAYLKLKPGADHAAVEKKIREEQAKNGKDEGKDMEITNEGDFMIMRKKGEALPTAGSPERTKAFADAMSGSNKGIVMAFVPTPDIRTKMKEEMKAKADTPEWAKDLGPLLSESKSMSLDIQLGDAPMIGVNVNAADEAAAKGLAGIADNAQKQLAQYADQMKSMGPQGAPMAAMITAVADSLKTTTTGAKVSMNIDAAKVGPAVQQMLPMIMMGRGAPGGGGGGGPAPKPGGGL